MRRYYTKELDARIKVSIDKVISYIESLMLRIETVKFVLPLEDTFNGNTASLVIEKNFDGTTEFRLYFKQAGYENLYYINLKTMTFTEVLNVDDLLCPKYTMSLHPEERGFTAYKIVYHLLLAKWNSESKRFPKGIKGKIRTLVDVNDYSDDLKQHIQHVESDEALKQFRLALLER